MKKIYLAITDKIEVNKPVDIVAVGSNKNNVSAVKFGQIKPLNKLAVTCLNDQFVKSHVLTTDDIDIGYDSLFELGTAQLPKHLMLTASSSLSVTDHAQIDTINIGTDSHVKVSGNAKIIDSWIKSYSDVELSDNAQIIHQNIAESNLILKGNCCFNNIGNSSNQRRSSIMNMDYTSD